MSEDAHNVVVQPEHHIASRKFAGSGGLGKLADALAKAQGEIEGAKKDAANPFFHSKYADLASVWEACRGPLSKNGLAIIQLPGSNGEGLFVDTILTHASGEWISSRLYLKPGYTNRDGDFVALSDPQAIGSAITYGRRYGLQAMVGIAPEDDDGNAASGAAEARQHSREAAAGVVGREEPRREGEVLVHFGKHKGKPVSELEPRTLARFRKNHEEAVTAGKKRSDADTALYEAVKAEIEKRKGASPTPNETPDPTDQIPMFNGAKHEVLHTQLKEAGITPDDFMEAMRATKQLPEHAKTFGKMSDETAGGFLVEMPNVLEVVRKHIAQKEKAA